MPVEIQGFAYLLSERAPRFVALDGCVGLGACLSGVTRCVGMWLLGWVRGLGVPGGLFLNY